MLKKWFFQLMYKNIIKPFFDFVSAILIFAILLPVFLIITFILIFVNRDSPFFKQERPGKNKEVFTLIKFKTMTDEKDPYGKLLPDAKRLTTFGKFVRSTSLDELPQLINVIKGDMSLVGPRPLLMRYLDRYNTRQARRHEVKPGITGLAQVKGRNAIPWEERLEWDVKYVEHISFWLDLKILGKTFLKVIKREGISAPGQATMKEFEGDNR